MESNDRKRLIRTGVGILKVNWELKPDNSLARNDVRHGAYHLLTILRRAQIPASVNCQRVSDASTLRPIYWVVLQQLLPTQLSGTVLAGY